MTAKFARHAATLRGRRPSLPTLQCLGPPPPAFHLASYPAPVEARQRSWPCIASRLLLFGAPTLLTSHFRLCQVLSLFLLQLLKALVGFRDKLPKHTLQPRFLCIAENFEVRPLTSHYCLKLGDLHLQCPDLPGNGNSRGADGWGSCWRRVPSCRCHSVASATRVAFPAPWVFQPAGGIGIGQLLAPCSSSAMAL